MTTIRSPPFLTTLLIILLTLCSIANSTLPLRTIYQFPISSWVENIAVRSNGNLLVTLVTAPELWEINPFFTSPKSKHTAKLIHSFADSNATYLTGITELEEDVFVVVASNTIWTVDVRNDSRVVVRNVVTVPGKVLNGLTTLDAGRGVVLCANSTLGEVWRIDILTGEYGVVLKDGTMTALPFFGAEVGVNGVKMLGEYLYYDNSGGQLFCRVKVDDVSGEAVGGYEVLVRGVVGDDFAIDEEGVAYLAGSGENVVTRVWPNGTAEVVVGNLNSSAVAGATAAASGRTKWDKDVLYVTTEGGLGAPINGTYVEGGKIVAIYT